MLFRSLSGIDWLLSIVVRNVSMLFRKLSIFFRSLQVFIWCVSVQGSVSACDSHTHWWEYRFKTFFWDTPWLWNDKGRFSEITQATSPYKVYLRSCCNSASRISSYAPPCQGGDMGWSMFLWNWALPIMIFISCVMWVTRPRLLYLSPSAFLDLFASNAYVIIRILCYVSDITQNHVICL